jgi:hypothetical protein
LIWWNALTKDHPAAKQFAAKNTKPAGGRANKKKVKGCGSAGEQLDAVI